jgi:hypothetical protein
MHPESGAVGQEIPNGRLSTNPTIFLPFHRKSHLYFGVFTLLLAASLLFYFFIFA